MIEGVVPAGTCFTKLHSEHGLVALSFLISVKEMIPDDTICLNLSLSCFSQEDGFECSTWLKRNGENSVLLQRKKEMNP